MDQDGLNKEKEMAVVEYMYHVYNGDHRDHIPGFVRHAGQWHNPADETFVGWTPTKPKFYVPDTLVILTKEDFVVRALAIHVIRPLQVMESSEGIEENELRGGGNIRTLTTEEEVRAHAEEWYDNYVAMNLAEEAAAEEAAAEEAAAEEAGS